MDAAVRIERALTSAIAHASEPACPPRLAAAVRHAVFPKGSRVRPRLCLAVASACDAQDPALADGAAAAVELLHCASLVHDDLPCFDDAATRRGRPSVHAAFGEAIAVLAGDALIVLAFETTARTASTAPGVMAALIQTIGRAAGMPYGISAGQAWECEPQVDLAQYHRAKTGALFIAAAAAGAIVAGADPEPWRNFGDRLGQAYQVADDIRDAAGSAEEIGKPVHQDLALGRPSAVIRLGVSGAVSRLEQMVADAIAAIPPCHGARGLRGMILSEANRLLPKQLSRRAA
jgi:geranylgeranyl diphosphate synthase type II